MLSPVTDPHHPWRHAGGPAGPPADCGRPPGDGEPARVGPDAADVEVSAAWRNCGASLTLVRDINTLWPGRDRTSDGTIGDAAHASRDSDHNPWVVIDGVGVVRARDVDVNGIDAGWLFEVLRRHGAAGDPRLTQGGYLILNRRITTPDFSGWRLYTGPNPHTGHGHVSFSRVAAGFDSRVPWNLTPQQEDELAGTGEHILRRIDETAAAIVGFHRQQTTALDHVARRIDETAAAIVAYEDGQRTRDQALLARLEAIQAGLPKGQGSG